MEQAKIELLVKKQLELGSAIEKLSINYYKDSKDRKNVDYLNSRLETLDINWKEFEANDDVLREFCIDPPSHEYFAKEYFNQVERIYMRMKEDIAKRLSEDIHPKPRSSQKQPVATTSSQAVVMALTNAMTTMRGIIATANDPTIQSTSIIQHLIGRLEKYLNIMEEKERSIANCGQHAMYPQDEYQVLQAQAEQKIIELKGKLTPEQPRQEGTVIQELTPSVGPPLMKLSQVSIPKFNGDTTKWTQFHDLYTQLVHNQNMSKAVKMFYLKDNITGEAERVIRHLTVSEANYDIAWAILREKYDDPRELLNRWLEKIVNQRTIQTASAENIKQLHDTIREATLAVGSLNINPEQLWEAMILFLISSKLDNTSKTLYEQSLVKPQALQPLSEFITFLHTRYRSLNVQGLHSQCNSRHTRTSMMTSTSFKKIDCAICHQDHAVYQCDTFLKMTTAERNDAVFKAKLCINCLKRGHLSNQCKARTCLKCNKRHNTLLHNTTQPPPSQLPLQTNHVATTLNVQANEQTKKQYAILATALVEVADKDGVWTQCRALIDPGSQVHIVTERLRQNLKLDSYHINNSLTGIGESRVKINNQLNVKIRSRTSTFTANLEALVIKSITSVQPQQYICTEGWEIDECLPLADPKFNVPQKIDMLIGVELYGAIIEANQIRLKDELPILQASTLGWLIIGPTTVSTAEINRVQTFCGIGTLDLDDQIKRFWELEEYLPTKRMTSDERKCEGFYDATTIRENGRFTVNIPLRANPAALGDSRALAYRRFLSIERKLMNNSELQKQYIEFMREYEQQGHMRQVDVPDIQQPHYYLPHHCVLKPSSSTTKLRVVFDASAKTSNNVSLNEIMLAGPKVQDDIFAIIIRFRTRRYVFTADIRQMYRQINISPEDRNLQLIFWRENEKQPLRTYQLLTVTYGTKSAPYLATKCLQRLAEDEEDRFPAAAKAMRDFYVDDIITGADEVEEAIEIQTQLQQVMQEGGFQLRKWCANHPNLLKNIPKEHLELQLDFTSKEDDYTKPLGLIWHPVVDEFQITVNLKAHGVITKRTILSDTAQLFDPLGLVNPVIVSAKIFMQQLWKMKLEWDEEVPTHIQSKWIQYRNELAALQDLRFPRYVFANMHSGRVILHAFADASERAYGTAIYVRTISKLGTVTVRLLCAKSRVAPLKQTKLPLLELCAAKMAAELIQVITEHLTISLDEVYFWSDSEIVLNWIQRDPATLVTFVGNRVADIQTLSDVRKWRYVPSQENPADLVSRGCTAQQLCTEIKWLAGPEFLKGSQRDWPTQNLEKLALKEYERTLKLVLTTTQLENGLLDTINHGNSFMKLQRIMAFVIRAIRRFKRKKNHQPNLTAEEMRSAYNMIFSLVQQEIYANELKDLKQNKQLSKGSALISLAPFIDDNGLIRVGGRLQQAALTYNEKHPIVLPPKHVVTRLYLAFIHTRNLHAGPQAMNAIARQRVWIVQGRQLARSIVNSCIRCARIRPKCATQVMGQLPATRVTAARPFINCGVDFCGPIWTHFKIRGKRSQKSYIAVFCCFATKAVHIEVVSDLTTEAFIGALKRFTARRGGCKNIYCDNAKNFVGANNQLRELQEVIWGRKAEERISTHCSQRHIQFHFIPPRSPHMGGLWEAAVKSLKYLLWRTVASASLTYEELCTVASEVEAVLNSRPLTPMSSDPNDFNALTPGHFLIGEPITATVDPQESDRNMSLLSRWQLVSFCRNDFWKRWSNEYVTGLQKRAKWVKEYPNMVTGTLVLIKDDNLPPLQWSMGRIEDLTYGPDNHVRVAYVRTATGTLRRAIHTLAPLPIDMQETSINTGEEEDTTRSDPTPPTKQRRLRTRSLSTMLMVLVFVFPLVFGSDLKHATILPLETNAGMFYDLQGQVFVSPTHWTIMAYFNLSGYLTMDKSITTLLERMQATIPRMSRTGQYQDIINHFAMRLNHLRQINGVIVKQTSPPRVRRAPINVVGTIVNKLFGILDEDYAEEMKKTIGNVNSNEHYLDQLMKNQTSLLDSTINVIKRDRAEIIEHTLQIQRKMKEDIGELTNKVATEVHETRAIEQFNLLSSIVLSYLQEYEQVQDTIADITFGLHQGHTSIHVISPEQLHEQLELIRKQLPPSLVLPQLQATELHTVYTVMTTQGRISGEYFLFKIHIPLLLSNRFKVYHLISVPIVVNNTQLSIEPTTEYLAMDLQGNQYYPLTINELQQCAILTTGIRVCQQRRPIEEGYARNHQCESELMLAKTLPASCSLTVRYPMDVWHQLAAAGTWLYAVATPGQLSIICNNGVLERATLREAGILSLDKGCTLRVKNVTLVSYDDLVTKVELTEQPQFNLTLINDTQSVTDSIKPHPETISSGLLFHQSIKTLEEKLKIMQRQQHQLKELQPHDLHQYSVSYTTLALVLVIILYMGYRTCHAVKRRHTINPDPFTLQGVHAERPEDVGNS